MGELPAAFRLHTIADERLGHGQRSTGARSPQSFII